MKTLTIAIPTYNRAVILKKCLSSIFSQINGLEKYINILVSDNNSEDNTFDVVNSFILSGYDLIYNKNKSNIGMDMNFRYCFNNTKSKYVWILGDDDFILDGALNEIITILNNDDLGILYLETKQLDNSVLEVYTDSAKMLSKVSFYITFISSIIVSTHHISKINFDKYKGSYLNYLQVYLDALFLSKRNAKYNKLTMDIANDQKTNGGYNVFKVFVENYLNILKDYRKYFSLYYYELEKFRLLKGFVRPYLSMAILKSDSNFNFNNFLSILLKKYWYEPYFYLLYILIFVKSIFKR